MKEGFHFGVGFMFAKLLARMIFPLIFFGFLGLLMLLGYIAHHAH